MASKILIADDHPVFRQGLRALLEGHPEWTVCAEVADGREAVLAAERERPDVAIIDVSMPDLNGLEATRRILAVSPQTRILILTMHDSETVTRNAVEAGASGYLVKGESGRQVIAAVESLLQGSPAFPAGRTSSDDGERRSGGADMSVLSSRESEVVQLIAEGKSTKEVAVALGIAVKTAEAHRTNAMRKLGLHSVADVVRWAIRNGIAAAQS